MASLKKRNTCALNLKHSESLLNDSFELEHASIIESKRHFKIISLAPLLAQPPAALVS